MKEKNTLYKIARITDHNDNDKDQKRVGLICEKPHLSLGYHSCLIAPYVSDAKGNNLFGKALRTSPVVRIVERKNEMIVKTVNSIYYFEKL